MQLIRCRLVDYCVSQVGVVFLPRWINLFLSKQWNQQSFLDKTASMSILMKITSHY
jgi:hypothetical protein